MRAVLLVWLAWLAYVLALLGGAGLLLWSAQRGGAYLLGLPAAVGLLLLAFDAIFAMFEAFTDDTP